MLESRLQSMIEDVYRLDRAADVSAFRIDRDTFAAVVEDPGAQREALVVHHDGDATDLALFLCDDAVERANRYLSSAATKDLDSFCAVAEGVSHFVYFTFCGASLERPVSQIELELQAEIDKFVMLRMVAGRCGYSLLRRLFEGFELRHGLASEDRERYRLANRAARRYARWLEHQVTRGRGGAALADARRLYRMPLNDKLERIAQAA